MPRPSQNLDQALLASGRALFPEFGCAGLAVRAVAEHAGVTPAMFHYHFGSKDEFLRTLLQQMYEEMWASLAGTAARRGPPLARLRAALGTMARFARAQRALLARVLLDALGGEPVALDFVARNAPRHMGLLAGLLEEMRADGAARGVAPLQGLVFMLGAVLMPIVFVSRLAERGAFPASAVPAAGTFDDQVMSDAAIDERIERALAALAAPLAGQPARARARRNGGSA
jgi:AcrR family transcriptional regulator